MPKQITQGANGETLCRSTTWLRSAALEAGHLVLIIVCTAHRTHPVARFEVFGEATAKAAKAAKTVLPRSMTLEARELISEIVGATELQEVFAVYVCVLGL